MDLEVTSTSQQDVTSFMNELRSVVAKNDLVWVEMR